jgi:hypothetical protein
MTQDNDASPNTTAGTTPSAPPASETEPTSEPTSEPTTEQTAEPEPGPEAPTETDRAAPEDTSSGEEGEEHLVPHAAVMDFRARWEAIQQGFVDDPRSAVTDADALVSDVLEKLSTTFEDQHHQLETQWSDGEPDTEELRTALRRYRDFFDRLLAI